MSLPIPVRWLPFGFLFLLGALSTGCHRSQSSAQVTLPAAPVVRVGRTPLSNRLEVAGEFLPFQEVEIHAKVAGYIRKIYVDIGDRVHAGQLLAELEIPEMTAQVEGAQAVVQRSQQDILSARSAVVRAEADYAALHAAFGRLKQASAARPGLIAQQELDDAEAKDLSAKAQVEAARSELASREQGLGAAQADHRHYASLADYSHITAPFDGIVTWRYADTGTLLQAGTSNSGSMPAIKLAQVNILRLRLPVPESLAGYVHIGDTARIHVQATGEQLTGKVVRTTGELDLATRSLQVEIDLDNKDGKLTPGMYADVTLDIQRSGNGLTIPVEAVDRSQSAPFAFVVNQQGHIEKRTLHLGMETPHSIEVIDGLREGERVVVANLSSFQPGEAVEAREVTVPNGKNDAGSEEE
jgi:RND family efflux transporter MFP subunit